jgi:hypothetical protein
MAGSVRCNFSLTDPNPNSVHVLLARAIAEQRIGLAVAGQFYRSGVAQLISGNFSAGTGLLGDGMGIFCTSVCVL